MPKRFNINVSVHMPTSKGYRVKVHLIDFGIYINGFVVYPPNDDYDDWGVVPPSRRAGRGKYAYLVEFDKKQELWLMIYDTCVEAVKACPEYIQAQNKDTFITNGGPALLEDAYNDPSDQRNIIRI